MKNILNCLANVSLDKWDFLHVWAYNCATNVYKAINENIEVQFVVVVFCFALPWVCSVSSHKAISSFSRPISHNASMVKALLLTSFSCSALAEVANLERSQSLQARECILVLAIAVRVAYKIHQFSGGFNQDCTEMFEKVRRLGQYYLRSQDPQWLKETTRISGYRWDSEIWWAMIRDCGTWWEIIRCLPCSNGDCQSIEDNALK